MRKRIRRMAKLRAGRRAGRVYRVMQAFQALGTGRTVARGHRHSGLIPARVQGIFQGAPHYTCPMASQKAIFPRDTGLQFRMLLTLFLLGLLYVALRGRAVRGGRERGDHAGGRRRARARAALPLGQAGAGGDGRQGGHPRAGPRPARDDRAPVHPGRPAQAQDRGGRHADAQRLRDGALAQEGHGLRHHRDHEHALPRRARGRHGARARAREEPRRADHDHRQLLRLRSRR